MTKERDRVSSALVLLDASEEGEIAGDQFPHRSHVRAAT
jgi:hypothetical protein